MKSDIGLKNQQLYDSYKPDSKYVSFYNEKTKPLIENKKSILRSKNEASPNNNLPQNDYQNREYKFNLPTVLNEAEHERDEESNPNSPGKE